MGWDYTDAQRRVMDQAGQYGHQRNPRYEKNVRDSENFWNGWNPKGKLTDDTEAMAVDAGVARENAVSDTWDATPMGMGSATGSLMAGRAAMARTAGDDALIRGRSDAYVQGGINKTAETNAQFNAGEARYLAALGIKAGIANNPHETVPWWKQLAMAAVGVTKQVAAAAAMGGAMDATGNIGTGGAAGGTGVGGWGGYGANGYPGAGV